MQNQEESLLYGLRLVTRVLGVLLLFNIVNGVGTVVNEYKNSRHPNVKVQTDTTVIHDTIIQYKEKAELSAEMNAFLKRQSDNYWSAFDKEYQQYEERIDQLLNGESGDKQKDTKMANELWTLYENLLNGTTSEFENQVAPALKKKFPDAQYVESFEISTAFYKFSNLHHNQISQRLAEVNLAIKEYDQ